MASVLKANEPPPTTPPANGSADFSQVVQESRTEIHNAENPPPKLRRGRGPGRKHLNQNPAPPSTPIDGSQPSMAPQGPPNIAPHLVGPLIAISTLPASRLRIPELALSKDEALACATSLNEILTAFAPTGQMNPKTAAILGAAVVFGSIGITKYQIYIEKSTPPPQKVEPPVDQAKPVEAPGIPVVNAADFYKAR